MPIKPAIINGVTQLKDQIMAECRKVDKGNSAAMMAEAFFWKELATYADNRYATFFDKMVNDGALTDPKTLEDAGDFELGETKMFLATCKVSEKVRYFDPDALAGLLVKSKYKVPVFTTKEFCEKAKVGKSPRRTVKFVER
jgi:hypothetical protein